MPLSHAKYHAWIEIHEKQDNIEKNSGTNYNNLKKKLKNLF